MTETKWNPENVYRELSIEEIEMIFAFYDKYYGNINQMVLDVDIPFKSYGQLHFYCHKYKFKERLIEIRRKRAESVIKELNDAKLLAVQKAIEVLKIHNVFVYNRNGVQLFDKSKKPLIIERHPNYKEIKTAWEIIKTELGEPTTISKGDITSGGKPINHEIKITVEDMSNEPEDKQDI